MRAIRARDGAPASTAVRARTRARRVACAILCLDIHTLDILKTVPNTYVSTLKNNDPGFSHVHDLSETRRRRRAAHAVARAPTPRRAPIARTMYAHRLALARLHAPRDRTMSTRGMTSRGTTIRVPASAASRRPSTTVVARARANDGRRDRETTFHTTQGVSARVAAMTRAMGGDVDDAPARARRSRRARANDVGDAEDVPRDEGGDALVRAMMGIFKSACGTLRWGLPTTGGLACWAAAAANAGDGLLGALSGSLLVGTTLGVCALIFAAASATLSGVTLAWMLAKRWVAGVGNGGASGRDARRGGVRSPGAARRRGAERRREVDESDGAYEAAVVEGRARADRFGNWQPVVPVVDPRAPGRWGGREGSPSGDPNAWGTHKTPADFRRERVEDEREDGNRGSIGPNEWQSRAAYRQAEGFNDPDLNGGARASAAAVVGGGDSHAEILKKFEPKERLLPRARPKPQHTHIPTEMLIAMGGASLETHIGANGKDILKTTREKRSSSILSRASRGSTTTVNLFGMGGRDRSSTPPPPTPVDERHRTPRVRVERSEESYVDDDEGEEDARRRARARFQKNLSSSFDFEPRSSYESEFMSNVMESMDAYDDEDEDMRALRRAR